MRRLALVCAALSTTACELQEVTVADAEPFVVVEAFLVGGSDETAIALHGSAGGPDPLWDYPRIRLLHEADTSGFWVTHDERCLAVGVEIDDRSFPGVFRCYVQSTHPDNERMTVDAGELYRLEVEMDGSSLTGSTRVPAQVSFSSDAGETSPCHLEAWTQLELTWNSADGAAAFLLELRAFGVRGALEEEGIEVEIPEPLMLRGLAIGRQDTTIVLPAEFGLFDRFSLDTALLVALQRGVPPGVSFEVTVAAVDQNFVNWVRGGDFNPSGLIRTPSMFGDAGTGVIGSMTVDRFTGSTAAEHDGAQPCGHVATS